MSSIIARSAFRASRPLYAVSAEQVGSAQALKKGAQKNPELYVLFGVMASVFAGAGYYFSSNPTGANEKSVAKVPGSEPWKTGEAAKFKYHPYGDKNSDPKDAPSPLRVSIIPDVNLPKELHERFNKYGKEGYP